MGFRKLDAHMRAMVDALAEPGELGESLERIVRVAADTIPSTDLASITLHHPDGRLETLAATAPAAREADQLQYTLREGPCYDAVTSEVSTYTDDLAHSDRWPRFGPEAAQLGLASQAAVRLVDHDGTTTGLNLYSRTRGAFRDEGLPELFASHARVALGYATQLQTLQGAIGTRETIGKAIGIVMERYGLSSERAFEFLIRMSQNSNIKLRDIAATIVDIRPRDDDPGLILPSGWDDVRRPGE
jgi:GAF domain-containing protein